MVCYVCMWRPALVGKSEEQITELVYQVGTAFALRKTTQLHRARKNVSQNN